MSLSDLKKSSAPLFVSFGSDPNECELTVNPASKETIVGYAQRASKWMRPGMRRGEIVCGLVPLAFIYKDENGEMVDAKDVTQAQIVGMLELQSAIYDGCAPKISFAE